MSAINMTMSSTSQFSYFAGRIFAEGLDALDRLALVDVVRSSFLVSGGSSVSAYCRRLVVGDISVADCVYAGGSDPFDTVFAKADVNALAASPSIEPPGMKAFSLRCTALGEACITSVIELDFVEMSTCVFAREVGDETTAGGCRAELSLCKLGDGGIVNLGEDRQDAERE